jgi:hypothetical protein
MLNVSKPKMPRRLLKWSAEFSYLRLAEAVFLTLALALSIYVRSNDGFLSIRDAWEIILASWAIVKFYYIWLGYIFISIAVFAVIEFLTSPRLQSRRSIVLANALPVFFHGVMVFLGMDIRTVEVNLWMVLFAVTAFNVIAAAALRRPDAAHPNREISGQSRM